MREISVWKYLKRPHFHNGVFHAVQSDVRRRVHNLAPARRFVTSIRDWTGSTQHNHSRSFESIPKLRHVDHWILHAPPFAGML
jgi:hypothetical protein